MQRQQAPLLRQNDKVERRFEPVQPLETASCVWPGTQVGTGSTHLHRAGDGGLNHSGLGGGGQADGLRSLQDTDGSGDGTAKQH